MRCAADFRADARRALKGNWAIAILTGFLAVLLGAASTTGGGLNVKFSYDNSGINLQLLGQNIDLMRLFQSNGLSGFLEATWFYFSLAAILIAIAQVIIGCVVTVGYARFNLDLVDEKEGGIGTLFRYFSQWGTMLAAGLLQVLYILLWSLLFVVPGIIAAYRYAMTSYILAENPEMRAGEAIARSKELMQGNKWRLFCLNFSFIGWILLTVLTLGIGNLWLTPYMETAMAAFYRDLVPLASEEELQADMAE